MTATARRSAAAVVAAAATCMGISGASAELPREPVLTLSVARAMAEACVRMSQEEGWTMHVAIKDNGDNLKVYARMDGASLGAGDIARQKASVSARAPWSTSFLAEIAFDDDGNPTGLAFVEGNVLFGGGLPIMTRDGFHLGGIGVSGGTPEQDEECAQAGLDAVEDDLT